MVKKKIKEKRHPIICPYCNTPMVFMKRVVVKDEGVFGWYVCPRRRENNENGCGHISVLELVYNKGGEYADPLMKHGHRKQ